jgi:hypothetical protein
LARYVQAYSSYGVKVKRYNFSAYRKRKYKNINVRENIREKIV